MMEDESLEQPSLLREVPSMASGDAADTPQKTLRDEYAIAALTGLLAHYGYGAGFANKQSDEAVSLAFKYADEALRQRGEG